MRRGFVGMAAVAAVVAVLACELGDEEGGGGGGGGPGPEQTVTLQSQAALDGWVREDGNAQSTGTQVVAGDVLVSGADTGFRGFYSFDLAPVPATATVTSATLRAYQFNVTGDPYGKLGNVVVDHVEYGTTLGGLSVYGGPALASGIGTLSTDATLNVFKTLVVTARVQDDVTTGRVRSQFRLRFSNTNDNDDNVSDYVQFCDAECFVPANVPELVVKYREPAP